MQDIRLAKATNALAPDHQGSDFASLHGLDLIFGGHDHLYYVSRGVTSWEGYDISQEVLGAEEDKGDVLIVKSGTDFRDLSELVIELRETPPGSVRKRIVGSIKGKCHCTPSDQTPFIVPLVIGTRHQTKPGSPSCQRLKDILSTILDSVSETMKKPVCKAAEPLDLRSELIRTAEVCS